MLVKDIGEFELIDLISKTIEADNAEFMKLLGTLGFDTSLTIGDDAAAWNGPAGTRVSTTDTMVENVHFSLDNINWRDLGWKSMAVNISDIASMGCQPTYSLVTLGLRGDLPVDGLLEMYRGMMDACRECGGAIVGGDIVKSPAFFITVAMEGTASSDQLLTRSTAKPGDQIAVTGPLGCSGGGLRMMIERASDADQGHIDEKTADHLIRAHHRPMPRIPQGIELVKLGVVTAMDVSDGLVDDLGKLCKASGIGANVHAAKVPVDDYVKSAFPKDWLGLALGGGEDYELLFIAPPDIMESAIQSLDAAATVIGEIVENPMAVTVLDESGVPIDVSHGGWDHLREG